ncbi:MAG: phosphodiesterase [Paracoccaceae bacterium]
MPEPATEIVVLTDTHFVPDGRTLYGLDPRARLDAAVRLINADHAGAALVLIAGDLAHWGEESAYEALREALAPLRPPVLLMLGNHDRRATFRAVFPEAEDDGAGFVQAVRALPGATLVILDTLDEGGPSHAGLLCPHRLAFLGRALAEAPDDRPLILAQHHPAARIGLPAMDRIALANPDAERAVLARAGRRPDLILHGHVHRPVFGLWAGIPFHIQRALNHQVAYDAETAEYIPGSHEPPDMAILRILDGAPLIHQRPVLYDGPRFSLADPEAVRGRFPVGG